MAVARLRQGLRALSAWARPVNTALAESALKTTPLIALFHTMRRSEQQHSLNVLRTLRARGFDHPSLMVAALLHDVGKSQAPFHLWDRVIVVLAKAIVPDRVRRWGQAAPTGWRRPFAVSTQHPKWSAELAEKAGADPLAVELIATHADRIDREPETLTEKLLAALQAADDAN
jgi:predicted hydrolase (HD superfamily)